MAQVQYENIPEELKKMPQWVCYKSPSKVPINPRTGSNAMSTNPDTWSDYNTAVEAVTRLGLSGVGFMLSNGIMGIDIDDCFDENTGEISTLATDIVSTVSSYTEISPSGTGLHILCFGKKPGDACRNRELSLEIYDGGRYFTVTGNIFGNCTEITEQSEQVSQVYNRYLNTGTKKVQAAIPTSVVELTDSEMLEKAMSSKDGSRFSDLYRGMWQSYYKSQSEADLGFCNMLAFWLGCDMARMNAVFKASGLMRKKWDEKHGKQTYGEMTLQKAVSDCQQIYAPVPQTIPFTDSDSFFQAKEVPASVLAPGKKNYSLDDTGNAKRFQDTFNSVVRYNHTNKCWYLWDGIRWHRDDDGAIKRLADTMLEEMDKSIFGISDKETVVAFKAHIRRSRSSKGKDACLKEVQHLENIHIMPENFDTHKGLLNVKNGVITLRNGELRPHARTDFLTKLANVTFDATATAPIWERFIESITGGDKELARYLQVMVGYMLSGSTQEQCVFFLYGDGANGKSTFIETIASMMGDYAMNTQPETIMTRDRQQVGARGDIARLKGARVVTVSETDEGARLNESLIKQMTGGEVLTARFLYGSEFEFRPEFKIIMATNHKPVIKGTDTGIWRRIKLIPFTQIIPPEKQDKRLPDKLLKELPGILNWCLVGCSLWMNASKENRGGLPSCKAVDDATTIYKSEQDRLQSFVEECVIPAEGQTLQASVFHKMYLAWCSDNGERFPVSVNKFGREMKKRFSSIATMYCTEYKDIGLTQEGMKYLNWGTRQPGIFAKPDGAKIYEQQKILTN